MLTPLTQLYLPFTAVMGKIGFTLNRGRLEDWAYFDLPFPYTDDMLIMDPVEVRDCVARTFSDVFGMPLMFETAKILKVIPENATDWDYYEVLDGETEGDYDVYFLLPDGEKLSFTERDLVEQMRRNFRNEWDALLDPHDLVGIWLDAVQHRY